RDSGERGGRCWLRVVSAVLTVRTVDTDVPGAITCRWVRPTRPVRIGSIDLVVVVVVVTTVPLGSVVVVVPLAGPVPAGDRTIVVLPLGPTYTGTTVAPELGSAMISAKAMPNNCWRVKPPELNANSGLKKSKLPGGSN